jgi:pullulanase/glycogen debranching enzyme
MNDLRGAREFFAARKTSNARVFGQLIYKWRHSRRAISNALNDPNQLTKSGWTAPHDEIKRDVGRLFGGNFSFRVNLPSETEKSHANARKTEVNR